MQNLKINDASLSGVLNINKPPGITSHDVVASIRRLLEKKAKVGHTGTLDPFATGVLLVAIGPATRLIEFSHDWNKEYEAVMELGATSDTDDVTGKISEVKNIESEEITKQQIETVLTKFVGTTKQVPPIYSAIKIEGERSYSLARQGSTHSMPTKEITIHSLELMNYEYPHLSIRISCSTGTYIRSLARDIGEALGMGAYVKQLSRSRIGAHKITDSVELNDLTKDNLLEHLLLTETLVSHLPTVTLSDDNVAQFYKGQKVGGREVTKQCSSIDDNGIIAVFNESVALLGVGYYDTSTRLLQPQKVLPFLVNDKK